MAVSQARAIAFDVLRLVESTDAHAADVLHESLSDPALPAKDADAALATELTLGVLRWQRLLDFVLAPHLRQPFEDLDLEVQIALRLGVYQLRFLDRIPAHAAVNESVELVKRARKSSAAGLVNAVLRRPDLVLPDAAERLLPPDASAAERLGILHSHPTWLVERWLARWGEDRTVALLRGNNRAGDEARATPCALAPGARREEALRELAAAGIQAQPARWLRDAIRVRGGNVAATEAFHRGWLHVQDEASQMVPLLLGVQPGQNVLDLCAAPGGKTLALVRSAAGRGLVVAADRQLHRLRAMRDRTGVVAAPLAFVVLDAMQPLPFAAGFERILADVPCSGTGTLEGNPEIRWRLRPEDLATFAAKQKLILGKAAQMLVPGGRLVYATCSLEPEENEQVVAGVLAQHAHLQRVRDAAVLKGFLAPWLRPDVDPASLFDDEGSFRTFPPVHATDGFFAAVIEKPAM